MTSQNAALPPGGWSLAVHGGAGPITRETIPPEREAACRAGLVRALEAGQTILARGGQAVDAVEAAVRALEDDPLFNAGRGSVFTADGMIEMDAAIMDGRSCDAGAVTGATRTRNPISLARAVMECSPHLLLAYEGADRFALQQGLEQAEAAYFFTPARWDDLLEWREEHRLAAPRSDGLGTVGAVARDCHGNLAAATSTGGTTGQARGRVGDSPLIGAGTYARNGECAVSATGAGEYLIRATAARQLCDRVKWAGETLAEAAQSVIDDVKRLGGNGGLIAMTAEGEIAFGLRDFGMYRGIISSCVPARTAVFSDERIAFAP